MIDEPASKRQGLGRGLSALLGEEIADETSLDAAGNTKEVPVEQLQPGRYQPRRQFNEEDAAALAASVRERGILQPILVRRIDPQEDSNELFEIVAGERRWRAAQEAQLHQVPVIIKDFSDAEALEVALIENLQREDLSPLEEAESYRRMTEELGYTHERVAQAIGRSRTHLTNLMRLLTLPDPVKEMIDDGRLTAGHARTLVSHKDAVAIATKIVAQGLTVRQAERLAAENGTLSKSGAQSGGNDKSNNKTADILALESNISSALGLTVTIHHAGDRGGHVRVSYQSLEQLDEICRKLAHR